MKLSLEAVSEYNQIHSYDDHKVVILQKQQSILVTIETNFILMPEFVKTDWPVSDLSSLSDNDVTALIKMDPEVIIFASGSTFTPQHQLLVSTFAEHAIGVEFMAFGPAYRTYNLLLSEERKVLLAVCF